MFGLVFGPERGLWTLLRNLRFPVAGMIMLAVVVASSDRDAHFVRAEDGKLFRGTQEIVLKSISFSNFYKFDIGEYGFHPETSPHHGRSDFKRAKRMGFNSIRFAINGNWYAADEEGFWRWLDKNVKWAERSGVLLTLDLHVPIGGFWLAPNSPKADFSIWTDEATRQKTIDMWRAIAARYRDRPIIAGYELLNEAVTEDDTGEQYKLLLGDLIKAVREVDQNHMLIVGALFGTGKKYRAIGEDSQFLVDDANVLYDFHFYEPTDFTHQHAHWTANPMGDGGRYPDPDKMIPTGKQVLLYQNGIGSREIMPGTSGWAEYKSDWVQLKDPRAVAGIPIVIKRGDVRGSVYFDDLEIREYDQATKKASVIFEDDLSDKSVEQWWQWEFKEYERQSAKFVRSKSAGFGDNASLKIDRSAATQPYWGWSSGKNWFRATPGNYYRIKGKMRGEAVAYPGNDSDAFVGVELSFYGAPADSSEPAFHSRGKDYLEGKILQLVAFGRDNNVPVSAMEFGTIRHSFADGHNSGSKWVRDVLQIFKKHDVSFSLWNYHGPDMGVFLDDYPNWPTKPNKALIDVLVATLRDK